MKTVQLVNGKIIDVDKFEIETNKEGVHYQKGKKYAICPSCGSSVQIIGGQNNSTNSSQTNKMYAAHTQSEVTGFKYAQLAKRNCIRYEGNQNNWQKIYNNNSKESTINKKLEQYIKDNRLKIAKELEQMLGFKTIISNNKEGKLFKKIYESFIENKGLYIRDDQFDPDYVSRLLIVKSSPVKCWGYKMNGSLKSKLIENFDEDELGKKFKPKKNVEIVGTLDDDNNPQYIHIKLIIENSPEIFLNKVHAKIKK